MSFPLCHKTVGRGKENEKENADIYILELDPHLNFSPSLVR
jgi:hypothetical protein